MALWLHGFYASHAEPYPMKVETFRHLCGSRNKNIYGFTRLLTNAHEDLVEVKAIEDFDIVNGLVTTDNVPSKSQQRHLSRAKPRKKQARG